MRKRTLSLGLAVLASAAFCAAAKQPREPRQSVATSALKQLVQLAQNAPPQQATKPTMALTGGKQVSAIREQGASGGDAATVAETDSRWLPKFQRRYPRYRVETGDALAIQFAYVAGFDQSATVQPDGYISLREVGDLHVEGLSVPEIARKIREKYSKILHDPVVSVELTNFEEPHFIVGGQVGHPGKYNLRGETSVAEAIEIAGGFTNKSKHSQVLLFRKVSSNWVEARVLNVKKMFRSGNLSEDMQLHPGDMIFVPQNRISKLKKFLPIPRPDIYVNPASF